MMMAATKLFSLATVLLLLACSATAHVCIITPRQRGAFDISTPGNPSCFRHGAPCGGQPRGAAKTTLTAGQSFDVALQQNYNHYATGLPGFVDVALSTKPDPTSDDDFVVLATIHDYHSHWQGTNSNFTLPIQVPADAACDQCVIRVRYDSHKEGEATFYQCADVTIKPAASAASSSPAPSSSPAAASTRATIPINTVDSAWLKKLSADSNIVYGVQVADRELSAQSTFVAVNTASGQITALVKLPFGADSGPLPPADGADSQDFALDMVQAGDSVGKRVFLLRHVSSTLNTQGPQLTTVSVTTLKIDTTPITNVQGPIMSLSYVGNDTLLAASWVDLNNGSYSIHIFAVPVATGVAQLLHETPADNTYINIQWTEVDLTNGILYVLLQNENDAARMTSILRSFRVSPTAVSPIATVKIDVSKSTFSSFHVGGNGQVLALSPGVLQGDGFDQPAYSLVSVDAMTGSVTELKDAIVPTDTYQRFYGGAIDGGLVGTTFTHAFRRKSASVHGLSPYWSTLGNFLQIDVASHSVVCISANVDLTTLHNLVSVAQ